MIIGYDASRSFIGKRTGTENYSYQILSHLAKIDHRNQYKVYLSPFSGIVPAKAGIQEFRSRIGSGIAEAANFEADLIPLHRLWTQYGLAKRTFLEKDLDVLFIPAHTLPLFRKPGLKTVVTVHDLGAEYLPRTHQLKQRLYLNFMTHRQLKSATHIIAVSKSTREDLINKVGIPADKITVVYEGYNEKLFKPVRGSQLGQTLKKYNLEDQNYFLFVGTIQPRKNLEQLIKAYAKFIKQGATGFQGDALTYVKASPYKKLQLVLAGSKGWLADEIYSLPQELGIEKQVKFLGYVPDEELPALYSGALAFLYPSLFEGFGLPILEAMACGCPVLTSNTSSCPEVAGNAAIIVNPYQEEEISKGISKLTSDPKLRKELSNKGFSQIKKFSWEKAARETLKVLESC